MVDEDDEPVRIRELDGEDLDSRQVVLDPRSDLALELFFLLVCRRHRPPLLPLSKKNGPAGPISPNR
jgi:hypothetical protein